MSTDHIEPENTPRGKGPDIPEFACETGTSHSEVGVDLDDVDTKKKHLEEITDDKLTLELLWTFRSVQQRMILRDSLLTRQAGSVPSLQSLSRDAVLLILSTNNTQERLVTPLVDRLEGEITPQARDLLLASYSEWREEM